MTIRRIQQNDFADVDALLHAAFNASNRGYNGEAELVAGLRRDPNYDSALEVVAMMDGHLVGYGLMTAASITPDAHMQVVALAPLAVAPEYQGGGIGGAIVLNSTCEQLICGVILSVLSAIDNSLADLAFKKQPSTNSIRLSQSSLKTI